MTIKTKIGYEIEVDKEKVLDYEFPYLIGCLQTDTPEEQIKDNTLLLNKLLGSKENVFKLFAFIREKNNGIVSQDIITDLLKEVFEAIGEENKKK